MRGREQHRRVAVFADTAARGEKHYEQHRAKSPRRHEQTRQGLGRSFQVSRLPTRLAARVRLLDAKRKKIIRPCVCRQRVIDHPHPEMTRGWGRIGNRLDNQRKLIYLAPAADYSRESYSVVRNYLRERCSKR